MRTIQFHATSALLGALIVIALGAMAVQTGTIQRIVIAGFGAALRVDGIPSPDQLVAVSEGQPFAVPAGKRLVLTGLATRSENTSPSNYEINVRVDGALLLTEELETANGSNGTSRMSVTVPMGLTAQPGSTVEVLTPNTSIEGLLLGYLDDI